MPHDVVRATRDYDAWVARHTRVVRGDLREKHRRMAEDPFVFLRATFYRWVERWARLVPDVARAPIVAAVGDLHMENFGTWRDTEGRLVWGVNDLDEAHPAPYTADLVRLAASVALAGSVRTLRVGVRSACQAIGDGYVATLERGGVPVVLEERRRWLRTIAIEQLKDPARFWARLREGRQCGRADYPRDVAAGAMPNGIRFEVRRRRAGAGSLGRPRFVLIGSWGGAFVGREIKALVPSAFSWATGRSARGTARRLQQHAVRVPDPFYAFKGQWLVRRLAPDCTKLDLAALTEGDDQERLLRAMGAEVANLHLASPVAAVRRDLARRPARWLADAARVMAEATIDDWKAWQAR